jgi:hypothetical protein
MKTLTVNFCIALWIVSFAYPATAQNNKSLSIAETIFHLDSLFWKSYNECDVEGMKSFCSDDIEFYHDKGGLTLGLEAFGESLKKGLCGREGWRLRREPLQETVKVYPLGDYGAIISGEHVFYVNETGNPEYLDGQALFTQVWLLKDEKWKMTRVFSYNHGPAQYKPEKKEIKLSDKVMRSYEGVYDGDNIKNIEVFLSNHQLNIKTGNQVFLPIAESNSKFFLKERDLQFEFVKDDSGQITKMMVWEKGKIVEEALKVK